MGNRTGTYCAFQGCGITNPTLSDFKYYARLLDWNKDNKYELHYINSHHKTYGVRDESSPETLKARLMERMSKSKNMILILSDKSSWNRGMLNFEIEKAVDYFKIPIFAIYTMYDFVLNNFGKEMLEEYWPSALKDRIENGTAKVLHIPFKLKVISNTLNNFSVHNNMINSPMMFYKYEKYKEWELLHELLPLKKQIIPQKKLGLGLPIIKKQPPFPRNTFL